MSAREFGRLRAVPLAEVMARLGARPDPRDKARWMTPRGPVSVNGMRFYNWQEHSGGGGAIDLVMHLQNVDFKGAIVWLRGAFALPGGPAGARPEPRRRFVPPARDDGNLVRVARYLEETRAIPPEVLEPLWEANVVYADARANAVFLHLGPRGRTPPGSRGCSLRRVRYTAVSTRTNPANGPRPR